MQEAAFRSALDALNPTAKDYWQRVAARVNGKDAEQCYDKVPLLLANLGCPFRSVIRRCDTRFGRMSQDVRRESAEDMSAVHAVPGGPPDAEAEQTQLEAAGRRLGAAAAQGSQRCAATSPTHMLPMTFIRTCLPHCEFSRGLQFKRCAT